MIRIVSRNRAGRVVRVRAGVRADRSRFATSPSPRAKSKIPSRSSSGAIEIKPGQVIAVDGTEMELAWSISRRARRPRSAGRAVARVNIVLRPVCSAWSGDTIWVLDAVQQRIVAFNPDLTPGTTIPMLTFDQSTMTAMTAPLLQRSQGQDLWRARW